MDVPDIYSCEIFPELRDALALSFS